MVDQSLKLDIPKPILFPNELVLKLTPVRRCQLAAGLGCGRLLIRQENVFRFYGQQQQQFSKASHQYCLVYVTTLRLIFIPFSKDIGSFKLSYSFSLPIRQIEKCHVDKKKEGDHFTTFISFHIPTSDYAVETSALHIESKLKRRIIDIASLISAIRYAYSVGKNLNGSPTEYDYEIISDVDTGYELFYHQLDPKLQNSYGMNSFANDVVCDYLPSYEESEKAVGSFFKKVGLLNNIVIRDRSYLENLQSLVPTGSGFDYYYDSELNNEFRPFLFINRDDSDANYGNYYYKFLAENALRYSERNVDDIVQVIYDNLYSNLSSLERSLSHSSSIGTYRQQNIRNSIATVTNNATIHDSIHSSTLPVPNTYHALPILASSGNIHDLIASDADTNDIHNQSAGTLAEIPDDGSFLDFFTAEGYSRITEFLDSWDDTDDAIEDTGLNRDILNGCDTGLNRDILNGCDTNLLNENLLNSSTENNNDFCNMANSPNPGLLNDVDGLNTNRGLNSINNDLNSHGLNTNNGLLDDIKNPLKKDDVLPNINNNQPFQNNYHNPLHINIPTNTNTNSDARNITTLSQAPQKLAGQPKQPLKVLIPNKDFLLDNNKFLENATDQSTSNYLSHEPGPAPEPSPILSPKFYFPSTPSSFSIFKNTDKTMSEGDKKFDFKGKSHILRKKISSPQLRSKMTVHMRSQTLNMKGFFGSSDSEENIIQDNSCSSSESNRLDKITKRLSIFGFHQLDVPDQQKHQQTLLNKPKHPLLDNVTSHERGSSSVSSTSLDIPFYYDAENPYSDIINNRVKYSKKAKQTSGSKKGHLPFSKSSSDFSKKIHDKHDNPDLEHNNSQTQTQPLNSRDHVLKNRVSNMTFKKFFANS